MADDDEDGIGSALSERFGGRAGSNETETGGTTGADQTDQTRGSAGRSSQTSGSAAESDATESEDSSGRGDGSPVRDRTNYTIYVSDSVRDDLDEQFRRFNAERTLDGKPEVQKHDHFIEAVLRAGLDHDDLAEFVEREFQLEE
ncbi:MAG: hypothetical protein ABEI99_10520 [Halobaculum sp.]